MFESREVSLKVFISRSPCVCLVLVLSAMVALIKPQGLVLVVRTTS